MMGAERRRVGWFGLPPAAMWIARRYLFARRHGYAAFVNWVSFVGLALGVTILTVVVSVMNGFARELAGRLLSVSPHMIVRGVAELPAEVEALPEVLGAGRHYRGEGLLLHRYGSTALTVMGVDAAGGKALSHIKDGRGAPALPRLFEGRATILLGDRLAQAFGMSVGDAVVLTMASARSGGIQPRMERFVLAGTFAVGREVVPRMTARPATPPGSSGSASLARPSSWRRLAPMLRSGRFVPA